MADNKLRCCVVLRLESPDSTMIAKYDHAGQYETHGGAPTSSLYGGRDKNYADAVQEAVSKDPLGGLSGGFGGFKVVQSDVHQLVYGADSDGLCIAVITGLWYPSQVAIKMLQELYTEFNGQFGDDAKMAPADSLTKKSNNMFSGFCKRYEDPTNVDKAQKTLGQVDQAKVQMHDNISGHLRNMDNAETLADKSDQLHEQANVFKQRSGHLRNQMRWKNLKISIILVALMAGILLIIILALILR